MAESTHSRATKAKTEAEAAPTAQAATTGNGEETAAASGPPTSLPVAQLVENSGPLLGQPVWVAGPALSGRAPDEEITIDLAKDLVQQWLDRPVEVDPAQQEEA